MAKIEDILFCRVGPSEKMSRWLTYLAIFFVFLVLYMRPFNQLISDDQWWYENIAAVGFRDYIAESIGWSARIQTALIIYVFLVSPWSVFALCQSFMMVLLWEGIRRLLKLRDHYPAYCLVYCTMLALGMDYVSSGFMIGSVTYIWPITAAVWFLYLERNTDWVYLPAILLFLSLCTEQGIFLMFLYLVARLTKEALDKKITRRTVLFVYLVAAYIIYVIFMSGVGARVDAVGKKPTDYDTAFVVRLLAATLTQFHHIARSLTGMCYPDVLSGLSIIGIPSIACMMLYRKPKYLLTAGAALLVLYQASNGRAGIYNTLIEGPMYNTALTFAFGVFAIAAVWAIYRPLIEKRFVPLMLVAFSTVYACAVFPYSYMTIINFRTTVVPMFILLGCVFVTYRDRMHPEMRPAPVLEVERDEEDAAGEADCQDEQSAGRETMKYAWLRKMLAYVP